MKRALVFCAHPLRKFVYGTQYYRPPTPPPNEWEGDLTDIKGMGFNTIKIWLMWRWHERKEGRFAWSDIDRIFDLCEKNNLFVVPQIMLETAPAWLFRKHHCYQVNNQGQVYRPGAMGFTYVGGMLPCFDHPVVRQEANRFIEEVVKRYRSRRSLLVWDIWNEPRSGNLSPIGHYTCTCEESKKAYRKWLKDKFTTVENLNNFLGKAWGNWEDIEPPSFLQDYAEMYLWKQWCLFMITDMLQWVSTTVKKLDKDHPLMTHTGGCSVVQDILDHGTNDWANTKTVDFYGTSFPCYGGEEPWWQNLINDWLGSISAYYWISEIYPVSEEKVKKEELRFWNWTSIASSAKGLLYWQYKPERLGDESNLYGLVTLQGGETNLSREANRIAKFLQQYGDLLGKFYTPAAKICLLYDMRSDLIAEIEKINLDRQSSYKRSFYKRSLQGAYALFFEMGIPIDFIYADEIEKIQGYKMTYLAAPQIVTRKMAKILTDYVGKGGLLISEASPGMRKENTWVNPLVPAYELQKAFGCIEEKRQIINEEKAFWKKHTLPLSSIISYLRPGKAKVIATHKGRPVVTLNPFEKGKALLIGTYLGIGFLSSRNRKSILLFLKEMLKEVGFKQSFRLQSKGFVSWRILENGDERILFLFNWTKTIQSVTISGLALKKVRNLNKVGKICLSRNRIIAQIPSQEVLCALGKL